MVPPKKNKKGVTYNIHNQKAYLNMPLVCVNLKGSTWSRNVITFYKDEGLQNILQRKKFVVWLEMVEILAYGMMSG